MIEIVFAGHSVVVVDKIWKCIAVDVVVVAYGEEVGDVVVSILVLIEYTVVVFRARGLPRAIRW